MTNHPYATVALFLSGVTGLIWLAGVNLTAAFVIATIVGVLLLVEYIRHTGEAYVSLDCADGKHAECVGCWCQDCPHDVLIPTEVTR